MEQHRDILYWKKLGVPDEHIRLLCRLTPAQFNLEVYSYGEAWDCSGFALYEMLSLLADHARSISDEDPPTVINSKANIIKLLAEVIRPAATPRDLEAALHTAASSGSVPALRLALAAEMPEKYGKEMQQEESTTQLFERVIGPSEEATEQDDRLINGHKEVPHAR